MINYDSLGNQLFPGKAADLAVTATGAAAAAVTCTLPAAGAGLFHYIMGIIIEKFATAALLAAATPILNTSANLQGSPIFNMPAEVAGQGSLNSKILSFVNPVKSAVANTVTSITYPATTSVIWRVTILYFVAQ